MRTKALSVLLLLSLAVSAALSAAPECIISCTYEEVVAPLGTSGEIGFQIQQRQTDVQSASMERYTVVGVGVQILEQTPWEPIGSLAFEKWVVVSLSEVGDGSLSIRSDAADGEVEELEILSVRVMNPLPGGRWIHAMAGLYPFDLAADMDIRSVLGVPRLDGRTLTVGNVTCEWPLEPRRLDECISEVRLFYRVEGDVSIPLLVVGDGFFYRCDHLTAPGAKES